MPFARAQTVVAVLFAFGTPGCGASVSASVRLGDDVVDVPAVLVDRAPPPPPAATRVPGPPPYDGAGWVEGHWEWDGLGFVWVDGYWIDTGGDRLVQPTWEPRGDRWAFVAGALIGPEPGSMAFRAIPGAPHRAGSGPGSSSGTVVVVPSPKP